MKLLLPLLALLLVGEPAPPTLERTGVEFKYNDRGVAVAIIEKYTVRWKGDGGGEPDSLFFNATATGQPTQSQKSSPPNLDHPIPATWVTPAIGQSITTQGCARIHRRQVYAPAVGFICSSTRVYSTPDSLPSPSVDTTLLVLRTMIQPQNANLTSVDQYNASAPGTKQQYCRFFVFKNNKVPVDATGEPYCVANAAVWFTLAQRSVSAKQAARGDSLYHGLLFANGTRNTKGIPTRVAFTVTR